MSYDGRILRRALTRFDEDKQRRAEQLRAGEREAIRRAPRIGEINAELSRTMAKIISKGLRRGTDISKAIEQLRRENLDLQAERAELLVSLGYPADYLERKPNCALCNDTGWRGSEMCSCLQGYYVQEQNKELSRLLDLGTQSFETFLLSYYSSTKFYGRRKSARENMERNYEMCRRYAANFPGRPKNLLLSGKPGLGKTFLSACIAREVSNRGFSVAYDTAMHIFSRFEALKFRTDDDEDETQADVDRVLRCDLLILDDLGTEMTTNFVLSALYEIINTRLMENRATVISTNLNLDEIEDRYGPGVLSRIRGEYELLLFYGEDIRKLKR